MTGGNYLQKIAGIDDASLPWRSCPRFNVRMIMKNHHHLMNTEEKKNDKRQIDNSARERKPGALHVNVQSEKSDLPFVLQILKSYSL